MRATESDKRVTKSGKILLKRWAAHPSERDVRYHLVRIVVGSGLPAWRFDHTSMWHRDW